MIHEVGTNTRKHDRIVKIIDLFGDIECEYSTIRRPQNIFYFSLDEAIEHSNEYSTHRITMRGNRFNASDLLEYFTQEEIYKIISYYVTNSDSSGRGTTNLANLIMNIDWI